MNYVKNRHYYTWKFWSAVWEASIWIAVKAQDFNSDMYSKTVDAAKKLTEE